MSQDREMKLEGVVFVTIRNERRRWENRQEAVNYYSQVYKTAKEKDKDRLMSILSGLYGGIKEVNDDWYYSFDELNQIKQATAPVEKKPMSDWEHVIS